MNFFDHVRRGAAMKAARAADVGVFDGGHYSGGLSRLSRFLPGSSFDYETEAGDLWLNSVVLPAMAWKANALSEGVFRVDVYDERERKYVPAPLTNPAIRRATRAFTAPNDEDDARELWAGFTLSEDVNGCGYWTKRFHENSGELIGFRWVSHLQIRPEHDPKWPTGRGRTVTNYRYTPVGGTEKPIDWSNVVRVRHLLKDPREPLGYLAPLIAELREICTDNELSTMIAALSRNGAVPSMFLIPKAAPEKPPSAAVLKNIEERIQRFVRDRRGMVEVAPMPMDVVKAPFSPKDMQVAQLRADPTARICAAMGLDPMVLGLPSENKTYSNYEEAADAAGKRTVIPTLRRWSDQVGQQTLEDLDLDPVSYRLWWDLSGVHWLLDETAQKHEMAREDYRAGMVDRATALAMADLPYLPSDVGVYYSVSNPATEIPNETAAKHFVFGARRRGDDARKALEAR